MHGGKNTCEHPIVMRHVVLETNCLLQVLPSQSPYHHIWEDILSKNDDNKFVDCAVAANAEYIVTNDKHFAVLDSISWPHISIVKLQDFAAMCH